MENGELIEAEEFITTILKPENDVEKVIIADPEFQEGAMLGEPRRGHPEGKIVFHIAEVLINVDKYGGKPQRGRLRAIALIHDTFKHKVDYTKAKSGENHHAMIARRFAERYTESDLVLDIIELHDEAYNAYSMGVRKDNWQGAEQRIDRLIERLGDESNIELYTIFYRCDNETGDKTQENFVWFREQLCKRELHQAGCDHST